MISVVKAGKWIAKHRVLILIVSALLMIPSFFGIVNTRVNYDLLSYLPEHLETVKGQDILVDEYGMGAFSMVVVEDGTKGCTEAGRKVQRSTACKRCVMVR